MCKSQRNRVIILKKFEGRASGAEEVGKTLIDNYRTYLK